MPNNPIWGHLKWGFRPFAPNNAIWGQVSKALSGLLDKQKSIVTSNAWIVTKRIEQFEFRTFQDAPNSPYLTRRAQNSIPNTPTHYI